MTFYREDTDTDVTKNTKPAATAALHDSNSYFSANAKSPMFASTHPMNDRNVFLDASYSGGKPVHGELMVTAEYLAQLAKQPEVSSG